MTLDEAVANYEQATRNLTMARDASTATRRMYTLDGTATARQVADANQASLDARRALEHARDQLVAAALDATSHHAQGAA